MEKSAIQHLQSSANFDLVFENFKLAHSQESHTLVPEGFKVEDLESYMPFRRNYRSHFKTSSVNDYIDYNVNFDSEASKCFIDGDSMKANTMFDLGDVATPGHQENKASLQLKRTAAYSSLLTYAGEQLSQKNLSDWLEDWQDVITVIDQEEKPMSPGEAARAVRNITIESLKSSASEVGDFSANMSELEKMNAKSTVALPSFISFTCKPYADLEEREFTMRLSILTGESKPRLVMRILKLESIKEEIVEEFKTLVVELLQDKGCATQAFIGSI